MKTLIMKLAVLVFFSLDARAGVIPQPELRPFDEILKDFKSAVGDNRLPVDIADAGLNQMEIWTQNGGRVKHHRFDLDTVNRGEPIFAPAVSEFDPELVGATSALNALQVEHETALARITELEPMIVVLDSLKADYETALARIAELEKPAAVLIDPEMVTDPPAAVIDPATLTSNDIHPDGVSSTSDTTESGSPETETTELQESDPSASTEVSSAKPSRKRGNSTA
jgi:hypothetical protein